MLQIYEFIVDHTAKGRSFLLFLLVAHYNKLLCATDASITIQKKNISVIEALKEVEKQSGLSVGYNDSQLRTSLY